MVKLFSSGLKGHSVVGAGGRIFGEVIDVEVDDASWLVKSLVIRVTSTAVAELGLAKPIWRRARLSIPTADVKAVTDVVLLRLSIEDFSRTIGSATAEPDDESQGASA